MREDFKKEPELIQAIIDGDEKAEEFFIHKFKRGLIWLGKKKVGKEFAEDIVQETFKNFFQNIRKGLLTQPISLKNYVYGIFKKVIADHFEVEEKEKKVLSKDNDEDFITDLTPEFELIEKEKIDIITEIIDSLPKMFKEIIILYYLEGYSVKEISALTNLPQGTVCYRLHSGRKKILKKANKKFNFGDIL